MDDSEVKRDRFSVVEEPVRNRRKLARLAWRGRGSAFNLTTIRLPGERYPHGFPQRLRFLPPTANLAKKWQDMIGEKPTASSNSMDKLYKYEILLLMSTLQSPSPLTVIPPSPLSNNLTKNPKGLSRLTSFIVNFSLSGTRVK